VDLVVKRIKGRRERERSLIWGPLSQQGDFPYESYRNGIEFA